MAKSPDLISVILPVRNGMPYLAKAVESILESKWVDLELLPINDGSTDETTDYLYSLSDPRVRILSTGGCGIVEALNRGIEAARGTLIMRQDADDYSYPERIERQVGYLQSHPDIAVIAACADFIDVDGNPIETVWTRSIRRLHDPAISPDQLRSLLPLTCCLIHGTVMARTSALRKAGGYRAEFEWAEDYDLWLRLLPECGFAKLPDRLYAYRIHPQQVSGRRQQLQTIRTIRAKLEYLRRIAPQQIEPIRAMILGNNIGTRLYQQVALELGFELVPCMEISSDKRLHYENGACCMERWNDWDVIVVTDFSRLEECAQLLSNYPEWQQQREGNFFIRIKP